MKCINRLTEYKDEDFDYIILKIKKGDIKCGKYAHLVKIDKSIKSDDRKELFTDGDTKNNKRKQQ